MVFIACYHPAFIQRSVNLVTGDVSTRFLGSLDRVKNVVEINSVLQANYSGEKGIDFIPRSYQDGCAHDFIQIPCGKCIGCRMDYSRSWADRMTYHVFGKEDCSYFITLTYDDEHICNLPHSTSYDLYALEYNDMSDFIKKLRNKFRFCNIDYYYSGEYGDQQFRPHFHLIVYNLPLDDLEYWKTNDNGDPIYTSEFVHGLWQKGICSVSPYNWRTAAYTARYVEKKRDGRLMCEYEAVGLTPEKCRCSRRPGIAHDFYMEHYKDIWKNNGMNVDRSVNSKGHLGIPRYFRKLAENGVGYDNFLDFQKRSLDRQNILNPLNVDNSSFDLNSIRQMLEFEEREILSTKFNKKL